MPIDTDRGRDPAAAPTSSLSIGLAEPDEMRAKSGRAVDRPGTGRPPTVTASEFTVRPNCECPQNRSAVAA